MSSPNCDTALRRKASPAQLLQLWREMLLQWKCYNCKGRGFPYVSVTALRGKRSWQPEAKKYPKVTLHNKSHARDLIGRKISGGWLPLLRREAAGTWAGDRLIQSFGGSFPGWRFQGWELVRYQVKPEDLQYLGLRNWWAFVTRKVCFGAQWLVSSVLTFDPTLTSYLHYTELSATALDQRGPLQETKYLFVGTRIKCF